MTRRNDRPTAGVVPGPCANLNAAVQVPTSKSLTNRALIAGAVADGGVIHTPLDCEDTRLLAQALSSAGWPVLWRDSITVGPRTEPDGEVILNLGNSGTGARLILSLMAGLPGRSVVDGSPRLRQRPMKPLLEALERLGVCLDAADGGFLPVRIDGNTIEGGRVVVRPGASSQYVTSLLMVAPLMKKGLHLELDGPVPSRPYLDLTHEVLTTCGVEVERDANATSWLVPAQRVPPLDYEVEGDWSAVAFMLAAVAVAGGRIEVGPLRKHSRQGDRAICQILGAAGLRLRHSGRWLLAEGPISAPISADLLDTPDLFPALAVVAASAPHGSRLTGLDHLHHKESDRLAVMVDNLGRLGAELSVEGPTLSVKRSIIRRTDTEAIEVTGSADHRIAMAMAVAALVSGPLHLDDLDCVDKSFPSFWIEWAKVTGCAPRRGFPDTGGTQ